jgi:hypothetical protein
MPDKGSSEPFLLEHVLQNNVFQTVVQHICDSMAGRINGTVDDTRIPGVIVCDIVVLFSREKHLDNGEAERTYSRIRNSFNQAVQSCILSAEISAGNVYDDPDKPMSNENVKLCLVKDCVSWDVDIIPLSEGMLKQYPDVDKVHRHTQIMYHVSVSANVLEDPLLCLEVNTRKDEMTGEDMESNILQSGLRDSMEKLDAGLDSWAISLKKVGIQAAKRKLHDMNGVGEKADGQTGAENAGQQKHVRKGSRKNNSQQKEENGDMSTPKNKGPLKKNVKQGSDGGGGGSAAAAAGPQRKKRSDDQWGLVRDRIKRQRMIEAEFRANTLLARGDLRHSIRRGLNNHASDKGFLSSCFSPQNPGYAPRRW